MCQHCHAGRHHAALPLRAHLHESNHSLIYINPLSKEWKTKQYGQYHDPVAMDDTREFTLHPFGVVNDTVDDPPPLCTRNHSIKTSLFSNGAFTGNLHHDYTDMVVPLFTSTHQFTLRCSS
jgi:hypothetical protein